MLDRKVGGQPNPFSTVITTGGGGWSTTERYCLGLPSNQPDALDRKKVRFSEKLLPSLLEENIYLSS